MFINLSEVFSSEGKVTEIQAQPEMEVLDNGTDRYRLIRKTPVCFTFTNIGVNEAAVTGRAELVFAACCDRCLEETEVSVALNFDRVIRPEEEDAEDIDELSFMQGSQLDTEAFIKTEIIENWPMKILCKEDCKGVCPVCGKNLNEGECGCDRFVPDPRMAVIKEIFNANKEV